MQFVNSLLLDSRHAVQPDPPHAHEKGNGSLPLLFYWAPGSTVLDTLRSLGENSQNHSHNPTEKYLSLSFLSEDHPSEKAAGGNLGVIREKSFGSFNQMDATQMPSPIGESFEQEKSVYPNPLETAMVDPETLTARKHKEERRFAERYQIHETR